MVTATLEPRAVDLRQAAKILDLSENVTRGLVQQGRLHSVRVGRRHVISLKEIDRFLDGTGDTEMRDPR